MARIFTTAEIVQGVIVNAGIPLAQGLFPASEILRLGDRAILDHVVPMIRKPRKGHFLTSYDQTTTTATSYGIHPQAMGRGLKNVTMVNTGGTERPLTAIDFDREIEAQYPHGQASIPAGAAWGYYVEGDRVILWPSSIAGETLRQRYERLPNRLCRSQAYTYSSGTEAAEAGQITSIDTSTGVITCSGGVPSTITTSTPICAVSSTPGFALLFSAVTPSAKSATTVTVSAANSLLVAVGDWIALEGDSPIVQLPIEAHGVLEDAIVWKIHKSLTDNEALLSATEALKNSTENFLASFVQRVEEAPKMIDSAESISDWICH